MSGSSYRSILRSSSIVGGAQVINIIASLLRMKAAALLLGPAGVGLVGLYANLIQTAATIASLGFGTVGARQIAAAHAEGGDVAVGLTRRALFWGTLVLSVIGGLLFWLLSGWIARTVLADESLAATVAWLSPGVALTIAGGSQGALLTGLRRVGDLARINVGAGVIGSLLGIAAIWLWGTAGLIAMALLAPLISFALGHIYVARLGPSAGPPAALPEMAQELRTMARLGVAFMLSGLVVLLGNLAVRTLVQRELGVDALGHFQAAWTISMTYLGFVLGAMGTDYYPRLTALINDRAAATRLVNEQTEVAVLLCAPVLLAMLGLAPWVIRLLYSDAFAPAVEILRWQLLGDVLKVLSWPLGFVLLAAGAGRTFVATETLGMGVFVLVVLLGLPQFGVKATGIAFVALYVVYLPLVWRLAGRRIGFRWTRAVLAQAALLIASSVAVDAAGRWSDALGAALGAALAAVMGIWAVMRLSSRAEAGGKLGRLAEIGERIKASVIRRL
jgi:O-antigen/teichoic acid export membrane protein